MTSTSNVDVLTVGEPMALFAAQTPGPMDEVSKWRRSIAGAELNVAIGLARLGLNVAYLSRVGADVFGRSVQSALRGEGISDALLQIDPARRTGFMLKSRSDDGSDPAIEYHRRDSAASQLGPADVPGPGCSFRWLHLTGVAAAVSPSLRSLLFELARQARAAGRIVSFDPNLRPQLWPSVATMIDGINELAGHADLVMPGLAEGTMLTGRGEPSEIAAHFHALGARRVIVKLGQRGAYAAERDRAGVFVPGLAVDRVVDTVGAGDGFAVGVISALLEGMSLEQAAARGNRIGARVVQFPGDSDGLPTRAELDAG